MAGNTARQRETFNQLVDEGTYSVDFDHAPAAIAFVRACLDKALTGAAATQRLAVLDCGCGTGTWLAHFFGWAQERDLGPVRLCGFDVADRMVDTARAKLAGLATPDDIRRGDLSDPASLAFDGLDDGFDVVLAYDVIQQLPPARQFDACRAIVDRLKPGGAAILFDNDKDSPFGRRMGRRKFFTRYFGLPLVPRFYCNAKYPPLARFRDRLAADPAIDAEILVRDDAVKRALIVHRGLEPVHD